MRRVLVVLCSIPAAWGYSGYFEAPEEVDVSTCFSTAGTCSCPSGKVMTGIHKTCQSLSCIDKYRCGRPSGSSGTARCQSVDVRSTFGTVRNIDSSCPSGLYLSGLTKSGTTALSQITFFECCDFTHASGIFVSLNINLNDWVLGFDPDVVWGEVPVDSFLVGLRRADTSDDLKAIDYARYVYVNYVVATPAPDTPAPDTSAPLTPAPATPAPDTPAPDTPAPDTPAPDTPAPDTPAPDTPAPDTPAPLTPAPATPAPDTPAPDTPAPDTPAPLTPAPATPAPDTPAPQTPAPSTPAPPTPSPVTLVPDSLAAAPTTAPSTPQPATPSPATAVPTNAPATPAPVTTAEETISTTGTVTSGAAALGASSSAGAATRLVLISGKCPENVKDQKFAFALHPTGLTVGGSEAAGVVLGNMSIIIGAALLMKGALALVGLVRAENLPLVVGLDRQGWLRFPSAALFVFTWLYQGTALGGMVLMMHPEGVGQAALGTSVLAVCIAVPVYVYKEVLDNVPEQAIYKVDESLGSTIVATTIGAGEWVSTKQELHWVNRYASVVRPFTQEKAWFGVVEYCASFSLAAMGSLGTSSWVGCGHVKLAMSLIFIMLIGLEAVLWPHARYRDCVTDFTSLGCQAAGLLLRAYGYYTGTDAGTLPHVVADYLFVCTGFILLGKVVLDILTELYVLFSGRRKTLQAMVWATRQPATLMSSFASSSCLSTPTWSRCAVLEMEFMRPDATSGDT